MKKLEATYQENGCQINIERVKNPTDSAAGDKVVVTITNQNKIGSIHYFSCDDLLNKTHDEMWEQFLMVAVEIYGVLKMRKPSKVQMPNVTSSTMRDLIDEIASFA